MSFISYRIRLLEEPPLESETREARRHGRLHRSPFRSLPCRPLSLRPRDRRRDEYSPRPKMVGRRPSLAHPERRGRRRQAARCPLFIRANSAFPIHATPNSPLYSMSLCKPLGGGRARDAILFLFKQNLGTPIGELGEAIRAKKQIRLFSPQCPHRQEYELPKLPPIVCDSSHSSRRKRLRHLDRPGASWPHSDEKTSMIYTLVHNRGHSGERSPMGLF